MSFILNANGTTKKPKISIITPSYNQGAFIEETICSIISQNYENLEYFIIDGGSTDNTLEIIKKYESHITYWVSESDNGQTHAINKGLSRATGDIIAYINSDDYYLPGSFHKVADHFQKYPETDLLHGHCRYINQFGNKIGEQCGNIRTFEEILNLWDIWWNKCQFVQPEVFWSRRIFEKIGFFNESLHYVMDYEYWLRILFEDGIVEKIDVEIACFRFTEEQKSNDSDKVANELLGVVKPFLWKPEKEVSNMHCKKLQNRWIYHAIFLKMVDESLAARESRLIRWAKTLKVISEHPTIISTPQFRKRLSKSIFR